MKSTKGKSKDGHKLGKSKTASTVKFKAKNQMHGQKDKSFVKKKKKNFTKENKKDNAKAPFKKNNENNKKGNADYAKKKDGAKHKLSDDAEKNDAKKQKKNQSETVSELMGIYETLRRKNTSKEDKSKHIDRVIKRASDKENEVLYKHDTVRVLEMCVKFGNEAQRNQLFQLFEKNLVHLVTSKYAKFLVEKFIEYGSKQQKRKIVESFYGKVKKLIKHKSAASILDEIFDKYANASQKATLVEEFYGPEFALFKVASGRSLDDILENEPEKKENVLKFMKNSFEVLCQKDVITHSIVHRALFDFFKYATNIQKSEIIELLKEGVVHILHTKDGAKVAMNCLWHGTAKDRKTIIKSFKTFVLKICKEEYGHLVMLSLFDVIDDTVLVKKAILSEVLSNMEDLMLDQYGRKVLLYLLKPRSPSYFLPDIVKVLQQGDGNIHSKKEASVRQEELRNTVLPGIVDSLTTNLEDVIKNKSASIVLLATLDVSYDSAHSHDILQKLVTLVKKPLKSDKPSSDDPTKADTVDTTIEHPICDACGHWVIKSIVQQDKIRIEKGSDVIFSKLLCEAIPTGSFADWTASNRSAFVLVSLLESGIESVTKRVKEDLNFIRLDDIATSKGLEILKKLLL